MAGDRYRHCQLRDLQLAVLYYECYIEVVVVVRELIFSQAHRINVYVCSLSNCFAAECEVCLLVQRIADRDIIAFDLLLFAIVVLAVLVALDRDRYGLLRDLEFAVLYYECYIVVIVRAAELICCQSHRIYIDVCSLSDCFAAECDVVLCECGRSFCLKLDVRNLYCVSFDLLLFAIVVLAVLVALDRDRYFSRIDREVSR